MRRIDVRALQKVSHSGVRLTAFACLLLVTACANEGILPTEPLPPAPAGPPSNAPSFNTPDLSPDQHEVLTSIEREELEARLTKMAKDRERGVQKRIQKGK